jgi:hypothetical protein
VYCEPVGAGVERPRRVEKPVFVAASELRRVLAVLVDVSAEYRGYRNLTGRR